MIQTHSSSLSMLCKTKCVNDNCLQNPDEGLESLELVCFGRGISGTNMHACIQTACLYVGHTTFNSLLRAT